MQQTVQEQNSNRSLTRSLHTVKTKMQRLLFGAVSRELPVETETIQTQLHQSTNEEHYTYTNVPWRLYLRKEVCTYTKTHTKKYDPLSKHLCLILLRIFFFHFTGFLSQRQLQQSSGAGPHFQTGNLRDRLINAG